MPVRGTHILGRGRVGVRTGQGMERMQASKGTHKLEWEEVRTSQNMERKQVSMGNSPPGEVRGQEYIKKASQREALTSWRG